MQQVEHEEIEDFKDWLIRYGRGKETADQYARNVKRAYQRKDPVRRLVDSELSPKYLRLIRASLRAWAEYKGDRALEAELKKVRLPPALSRRESQPLSELEWKDLRREINNAYYLRDPMKANLGMLVCRGFRRSDVLRMKKKEVTDALRKGVLEYEGKGRKRLRFTVTDAWSEYLEIFTSYDKWSRVEDLICPTARADTRRDSAGKAVARALKKCGSRVGLEAQDVYPHLLRHTYATLYYQRCKDPAKLQAHMQWSDISTAMGYVSAGGVEELDGIAESLFE